MSYAASWGLDLPYADPGAGAGGRAAGRLMRLRLPILVALCAGLAAWGPRPPPDRLIEDVQVLSADAMEGRGFGTPGAAKARDYLRGRLQELGLAPAYAAYDQPFEAAGKAGTNLVAQVAGTSRSDKVLVVTAHYDHLGVREGQVFNGADDNASGVAALLAVARSFKAEPPRHTTLFVLLDGEEAGSPGARAFLADPPVGRERIALNLNLDMLSRSDRDELYVAGARHHPVLRGRLEALAAEAPVTLKLGHDGPPWTGSDDWTDGSDHREFHRAGVPFVYFGVEDHPDYHRPTDDFAAVPQDFFRRSAATVELAARRLDRDLDEIAAKKPAAAP